MEKTITERLKDLNKQYKELDELKKWMDTERGHRFAKLLKVKQLDMLIHDFKAPKVSVQGYKHKLNAYVSVKHSLGIKNDVPKPNPNYAKNLRKLQESGKLKLPPRLSKKELAELNTEFLRTLYGNPIQKKDRKGRLLWDVKTNAPIYKTRPKNTIPKGVALKCHAYETHKIQKWERKNPRPTEVELKMFLFPEILRSEWETKRTIVLEHIRDELSKRYCNTQLHRKQGLTLLVLHKNNSVPRYGNDHAYWWSVADPYVYGYPIAGMNVITKNDVIQKKIDNMTRSYNMDLGFKVVDIHGHTRAEKYFDETIRRALVA